VTERSPEEIADWFAAGGPTLVALSGGVDSAVVAALGRSALGDRLTAATLSGPAVALDELRRAREVADHLAIPHATIAADPLQDPAYRANPSNRCYFCRSAETAALRRWGAAHGIVRYVDGVHRDDLGDDRPGLRAMDEAGFEHPLLWAGWGKLRVRSYARSVGLPNWDAPSDACLASRIPHGVAVEEPLLRRIERAERFVHARGFRRVRVRVEGDGARIELDPGEIDRASAPPERAALEAGVRAEGFASVVIDPRGYARRANA